MSKQALPPKTMSNVLMILMALASGALMLTAATFGVTPSNAQPVMPETTSRAKQHGATTELICDYRGPLLLQHDSDNWGQTTFSVADAHNKTIWSKTLNGQFSCIGYSPARKVYVIRQIAERISVPSIREIAYITEPPPSMQASSFTSGKYDAATILADRDLKHLAFIGTRHLGMFSLYVLETLHDGITRLGAPPAPPPMTKSDIDAGKQCYQWSWEGEGLLDLEPGIWRFDGQSLKVSYGKDTCRHRSKNRSVKNYKLKI
jgi:hypothetical protein